MVSKSAKIHHKFDILTLWSGEFHNLVSIEIVFEAFEHRKLFCVVPTMRYNKLVVGMEVFWPFKDLSIMNDEVANMVFKIGSCDNGWGEEEVNFMHGQLFA